MVFTFEETYDAYVHMFFGSHYAEGWFDNWNPKWYTGFNVTSYPPLVHQFIALSSKLIGLKGGFVLWGFVMIVLFIRGAYHFSQIFVPQPALKYVAFAAVFCFSFSEALHLFGQLPSLTGVSLLLNACPFIYAWFRKKRVRDLLAALALLALTTCAHHVTTIFGMIFFILPVIATAIMDNAIEKKGLKTLSFKDFFGDLWKQIGPGLFFGISVIIILVIVILPYWLWSKSDPITQVSIPHGSRANFLEETNLGIVFFLIPWGMMLFVLPYVAHKLLHRRNIFFGLSFVLCLILGTGGTTPIPIMLLGENAFNILTLDRFTFWGSVMAIPFWGMIFYELVEGKLKVYWKARNLSIIPKLTTYLFIVGTVFSTGIIINMGYFKPNQPDEIDIDPIVNFLQRDQHDKWRYLCLGFGDQMAWLSANTKAQTVDGNYHSVRRLPQMTTRAVERLENAKYLGMEGIGAVHQFLTVPGEFHMKYIFSNDKFYEPVLYFSGWKRVGILENGIVLWEKPDIQGLPTILPTKVLPRYQKLIWGLSTGVVFTCVIFIYLFFFKRKGHSFYGDAEELVPKDSFNYTNIPKIQTLWTIVLLCIFIYLPFRFLFKNHQQISPDNVVATYFDAIDFKKFGKAFSLFYPETYPEFENYILELSVKDGILASYAKLDSLSTNIEILGDDRAVANVEAHWITSLKKYQSEHVLQLKKKGLFWYLLPFESQLKTPPDQLIRLPDVDYKSHGRRTLNKTSDDDVQDRPELMIKEANLIESKEGYHVVGRIKNIDVDPASVTLEARLYNEYGGEIARYGVRDVMTHDLLPKESTTFRIDFEELQWQGENDTFDPEAKTPKEFAEMPCSFAIFANSVVTDIEFYKNFGYSKFVYDEESEECSGVFYNYGAHEITIPQLRYDIIEDENLLWVECQYLKTAIRSQKLDNFSFNIQNKLDPKLYLEGELENLIINGVSMESKNYGANYYEQLEGDIQLSETQGIRLSVNAFVNEINN